jgi:hypothetical protein
MTKLEKTLKREISIKGRAYIVAIDPEGLLLTIKGRRKGLQLLWAQLVTGEAALAVALNASVGMFDQQKAPGTPPSKAKRAAKRKRAQ